MKPADFGAILFDHPEVSEVYVARFEMKNHVEALYAFVVAVSEGATTAKKLKAYCNKHLAQDSDVLKIVMLSEMPRNRAGTVDREQLREYVTGQSAKEVA